MIFRIYVDTSKAVEIAAYVRKVLEVGTLRSGLYDYIAFAGGIKCEKLLGSYYLWSSDQIIQSKRGRASSSSDQT